jgi:hypothetical protein
LTKIEDCELRIENYRRNLTPRWPPKTEFNKNCELVGGIGRLMKKYVWEILVVPSLRYPLSTLYPAMARHGATVVRKGRLLMRPESAER